MTNYIKQIASIAHRPHNGTRTPLTRVQELRKRICADAALTETQRAELLAALINIVPAHLRKFVA